MKLCGVTEEKEEQLRSPKDAGVNSVHVRKTSLATS